MQVIGLCGPAGSGKSEVAKIIAETYPAGHCVVLPFAEPLKDLCRREFGWDGKKDERGRRLLQVVGTDAGRAYDQDMWVCKWFVQLISMKIRGIECVIADDVRFDNEAAVIRKIGGVVWRVERPAGMLQKTPEHVSEQPLPAHWVNRVIVNDGDLATLAVRVAAAIGEEGDR